MKQIALFGDEFSKDIDGEHTTKITTPEYTPRGKQPHILELVDNGKFKRLRREIEQADIPQEVKTFLFMAATRHLVFHYSNIADYYAQAPKEVQQLFERSALVIIDFDDAFKQGYVQLAKEMADAYLGNYEEEIKSGTLKE